MEASGVIGLGLQLAVPLTYLRRCYLLSLYQSLVNRVLGKAKPFTHQVSEMQYSPPGSIDTALYPCWPNSPDAFFNQLMPMVQQTFQSLRAVTVAPKKAYIHSGTTRAHSPG